MKKLLIAIIPSLIVVCLILTLMPIKSSADLAHYLAGTVYFQNGDKVGSGKPVYIHYSPTQYYGYALTNNESQYCYRFGDRLYVHKVRCTFRLGSTEYRGETIIDDTLRTDTWVDITVYPVPPSTNGGSGF